MALSSTTLLVVTLGSEVAVAVTDSEDEVVV